MEEIVAIRNRPFLCWICYTN